MPILAAPMLDDFVITSLAVRILCGWVSWMVCLPILRRPDSVSIF
jgi:hypothetical protein